MPAWCLSLGASGRQESVFLSHCSVLSAEDIVRPPVAFRKYCLLNELNSIWDALIICRAWPCLKWAHPVGCKQKCHLKESSIKVSAAAGGHAGHRCPHSLPCWLMCVCVWGGSEIVLEGRGKKVEGWSRADRWKGCKSERTRVRIEMYGEGKWLEQEARGGRRGWELRQRLESED